MKDSPTDPLSTPIPGGLSGTSDIVQASLNAYGASEGAVRRAHRDSGANVSDGPFALKGREAREEAEELILSPGATRARGAGVRERVEEADAIRTCFERDLDRIKHTRAFRRLSGKCQVFLAPDNVHIRNRMTHAIEVAQVATSIARALGLNLALSEAIALGHDCGHGPGGHASEDAFAEYVPGGFDHALWGADVVLSDQNLCVETLDGIRQHSWRLAAPQTPEGETVSLSDRLAYVCHDFDDAVRAGVLHPDELPREVAMVLGERQSEQIRSLVGSVLQAAELTGKVGIMEREASALDTFRAFNYERIYLRAASVSQNDRVVEMLRGLVEWYVEHPFQLPDLALRGREALSEANVLQEAVRYVSGMTDRFAMGQAQSLLGWSDARLPRGV